MSEEDREALRLGYEAYSRGDSDGLLRGMHPNIELKTIRTGGPYRGHWSGGSWRYARAVRGSVAEPEEWFDHGDRIVVFVRIRLDPVEATPWRKTGRPPLDHARRQGHSLRDFPQAEDALEAAGLSE